MKLIFMEKNVCHPTRKNSTRLIADFIEKGKKVLPRQPRSLVRDKILGYVFFTRISLGIS